MAKKKKVRVQLRKNRQKPPRENDITRTFRDDADKAGRYSSGGVPICTRSYRLVAA